MIGSRLGGYEITAKLGEGGMGEVYRASDTKLKREVAIKVLPAAFTEDPERLARFEREAQLLAQLHHPNIASVFGLEESDGNRALVMELVEGPTLAERLERGPLPLNESLSFALQIAQALEEAHEKGIVHRDLKPQNIKASLEGKVKVLDFGLAKAMDPAGAASGAASASQLAASPTLTLGATQMGVILGTAAYMAPEQAKGLAVDVRADIWAFGVVLFEMLTGRRLFDAPTVPETLALVLTRSPDLGELPASVPPAVRRLLRRCLERNPHNRLHHVADARIVLAEVIAGGVEETIAARAAAKPSRAPRALAVLPWLLAGALALALGWSGLRSAPRAPAPVRHVELSIPPGVILDREAPLAFAPDGSAIVFGASDATHGSRLWLRALDRDEAAPLEGTEGASFPFWAPDSKSIAYYRGADSSFRRLDLATRSTQLLARTGNLARPGTWTPDGSILFSPSANSPLQLISAGGGAPKDVTTLDPAILDGSHRFPVMLPDGHHFLFTFWSNNLEAAARVGGIYLGSFEKGLERRLTPDLSPSILAGRDRLIVYRDGSLVALRFDPDKLEVTGVDQEITPHPLFSPSSGALAASASAAGDVVFALTSGEGNAQLGWLDAAGAPAGAFAGDRLPVSDLALSRDGQHFAVISAGATGANVYAGEVGRPVLTRLTRGGVDASDPVLSPDGSRVVFDSQQPGSMTIFVAPSDASHAPELLLTDPARDFAPTDWSSDGRLLIVDAAPKSAQRFEIWLYDFETRQARPLIADEEASLSGGVLSPDGRWLAYVSDEAGNPEIFVRPFPALDRKWKLSQGGGVEPHWRSDGRELLFVFPSDRSVRAVTITEERGALVGGEARLLFTPRAAIVGLAPAPDHARFLAAVVPSDVRSEPIRLILGWRAGLAQAGGR